MPRLKTVEFKSDTDSAMFFLISAIYDILLYLKPTCYDPPFY